MFEEFERELRNLELNQGVQIPIEIAIDEKGYLDRSCPHCECRACFKVLFEDWRDKVPDAAAFCPKCGAKDDPKLFKTESQNRYFHEVAKAYLVERLDKALSRAVRRTRTKRIGTGFFDIEMSVSYQAGPTPVVLPSSALEVLRQDFQCEQCGCRYSTIGAAHFCPACGHNSATADFEQTIDTILKGVDSLDEIGLAVTDKYDIDVGANFKKKFLENQIEDLVTLFQRTSEALFSELPNANSIAYNINAFQNLRRGSELWHSATSSNYQNYLTKAELEEMTTLFERRHKLSHTEGMVDQLYVEKSGDSAYKVGQRLVIRETHVKRLAELVRRLVDGLREIVAESNS
ncbi:MAG: hypothetical protein J4G17_05285 [Anaerolineae bacterium]|nr:hypothetical protein [Anaerolineae bacterium]